MRLARLQSAKGILAAASVAAVIATASTNAHAYAGTISGYYDGTREVVAFADHTGALDLAYFVPGGSWTLGYVANNGSSDSNGNFMVGAQVTAYFDGTTGHIAWLGELQQHVSHEQRASQR